MCKLFQYANNYLKKMTVWDVGMLKICVFSLGIIVGIFIPNGKKRTVYWLALAAFAATYVPLMAGFFKKCKNEPEEVVEKKPL